MSAFDIHASLERAARRLPPDAQRRRKRRSDAGGSRLPLPARAALCSLLLEQDRRPMKELLAELQQACSRAQVPTPSRATVYQLMAKLRTGERRLGELPGAVREAMYNLDADSRVPEAQIAFYCFNYGGVRAMSFAAGLPWLALYQASRMRGWRGKSRGPLLAAMRARSI